MCLSLSQMSRYTCPDTSDTPIGHDPKDPTEKGSSRIIVLIMCALLAGTVATAIGIGTWKIKSNKRQNLSTEKTPFLAADAIQAAIQHYKDDILKIPTEEIATLNGSIPRRYSSLSRSINVLYPKENGIDAISKSTASNKATEIQPTQLLSLVKSEKRLSNRTLLVGDVAAGKSWAVSMIQQEWASNPNEPQFKCVIALRISDLNGVEGKITLRELLKKQCEPLSSVLTELLRNPHDVLIILDGLDGFRYQLRWNPPDGNFNMDTKAEVNVLVSKIISRDLLPEAQVLVTSRWNTKQIESNKKHFDCILIISGFTNDQLKKYCEVFCQEKETAAKMYKQFTENETITCLASNPLNSYILCNILDRCRDCPETKARMPLTHSKVFLLFLYNLFNCSSAEEIVIAIDKCEIEQKVKVLQDTVLKLGALSFNNLLSGKLEMNKDDLDAYKIEPKILSEYFSNFILEKKSKGQNIFEFYHVVLKEQFAALYCATSLNDDAEELVKCLDLWCFGETPRNQNSQFYLQPFQPEYSEKLYNFTRFLMGFLTAGRDGKLWNCTAPLTHSTTRALITWFKNCLERNIKSSELLNLMCYLFELHDPTVTAEVSPRIKRVEFFNVSLSPLDISALCYCLSHSTVEELDLRLCTLGDDGIKQLKEVLRSSKHILVSSNKLTEESAKVFNDILKEKDCVVEKLSIGTNVLKSRGTHLLCEALKRNRSLKFLYLYDNEITDEGIEQMCHCLEDNETLEILHLCGNSFGERGQRNIQHLKEHRPGLKIITYITEDEELIDHVYEQIEEVMNQSAGYDRVWLTNLLETILKNLEEGKSHVVNQSTKTKVDTIKENIRKLQKKLGWQDYLTIA
uniref:nucleotide-binding oligomerization domain-containing protein 1-like isoform X2 n=1 Tax=Pristiophorus japonicus TaxID=55135 RepID=UPI00398F5364